MDRSRSGIARGSPRRCSACRCPSTARSVAVHRSCCRRRGPTSGGGGGEPVAVLFSHSAFAGARFAHRFAPPGTVSNELIWLKEEIETGALHRMMRDVAPSPDDEGLIWTELNGALLVSKGQIVDDNMLLRLIAPVVQTTDGMACGIYMRSHQQPRLCAQPSVARASYRLWWPARTPWSERFSPPRRSVRRGMSGPRR